MTRFVVKSVGGVGAREMNMERRGCAEGGSAHVGETLTATEATASVGGWKDTTEGGAHRRATDEAQHEVKTGGKSRRW